MLVLSRKMDEQIVIGDEICITVLRVKEDRVKLGIHAGADVKIMRGELLAMPRDAKDGAAAQPISAIADPTLGLAEEEVSEDSATHLAGACDRLLDGSQPATHPAWLTICCCS